MDEETRVDETPDEAAIAADTGATPEEAHRIGEFDELRGLMEGMRADLASVADMVRGIKEAMGTYQAVAADNGVEVRDVDGDGDLDVVEEVPEPLPEFEDMDLDM